MNRKYNFFITYKVKLSLLINPLFLSFLSSDTVLTCLIFFSIFLNIFREHMSSFSLYHHPFCALNKILPSDHFSMFLIQHYYHQRHVSWLPTYSEDYNIQHDQSAPTCWKSFVKSVIDDESNQPLNYTVIPIPGQ